MGTEKRSKTGLRAGCNRLNFVKFVQKLIDKMRLTVINMFKKSVNGHIFRGKYRLVKRVTPRSVDTLQREYEQTERNMALLLKPYLTLEQSSGHAKELNKKEQVINKWREQQLKMKPHVTISDRLEHLNVKNVWE